MKRLLILVAGLLMVEESFALPKCPPWRIFSNLAVVACTYTWANGNKYVGEFKDGKRHGQGIYTLPEWGTKFIGEFKADKRWKEYVIMPLAGYGGLTQTVSVVKAVSRLQDNSQ